MCGPKLGVLFSPLQSLPLFSHATSIITVKEQKQNASWSRFAQWMIAADVRKLYIQSVSDFRVIHLSYLAHLTTYQSLWWGDWPTWLKCHLLAARGERAFSRSPSAPVGAQGRSASLLAGGPNPSMINRRREERAPVNHDTQPRPREWARQPPPHIQTALNQVQAGFMSTLKKLIPLS